MAVFSRVTSVLLAALLVLLAGVHLSRAQDTFVDVSNATADTVAIISIAADDQQQLLHELAGGETYRLTLPVGATLGFAQNGAWVGDAYVVTGSANEAVTVPYVAQAAAVAPEPGQVANPSEPQVQITNGSDQPIVVVAIAADQTQTALKQLAPGETYSQPATRGAMLGFAQGSAWLGDAYVVAGTIGEAVTLPYTAQAAGASAPDADSAQGQMQITNGSGQPVVVVSIAADQTQQALKQLAAGETSSVTIAPSMTLGFAQGDAWLGDAYVTTGAPGQAITLPYQAAVQGPATEEFVDTSLPPVEITNGSEQPVTIISIQPDNVQRALKEIAAGETYSQPATPGTTLGFAQGPAWLGDFYLTTGDPGEKVTVPYRQPTELQKAQQGPDSVEVAFDNTTGTPVTVAATNATNQAEPLYELTGGQSTQRALPGTKLWFYKTGESGPIGDPYVVSEGLSQQVTLPFSLAAAVAAVQEGPGSVALEFTNTNVVPIIVSVLDANNSATAIYDIPPGQIVTRRALPKSTLFFYREGEDAPVADYYIVPESDAALSVPYYYLDDLKAQHAGPESVTFEVRNETYANVNVAITGRGGVRADLYTIPYRNSADSGRGTEIFVLPGTKLFFFSDITEVVDNELKQKVEGVYTVESANPPVIYLPYDSRMASQKEPYPPGGISVMFKNSNSANVPSLLFVTQQGDNAFSLLKSLESWRNVVPGTFLFTYGLKNPGDAKYSQIGDPIQFDNQPGAIIEVPFYKTSTMSAQDLVASGKIDIKAIAAQITQSLVQAKLDGKKATACWRDTYGRGVGTVPRNCSPGQSEDTAGLCYDNCQSGYTPFVTMCVQNCPSSTPTFSDTGLHCLKPDPLIRDAYPWQIWDKPFSLDDALARCRADRVARGGECELANLNTIVYSTCPTGYEQAPVITSWCTPKCPAGMANVGVSCQKSTYDRGVGKLMVCNSDQDSDAGLCYDKCRAGFDGVGPVCWAQCPKDLPYSCGAGCAKNKDVCDQVIFDQATSPLMTAISVAFIALTAGGATGATAAANTAKAGATTVGRTGAELAGKAAVQETARQGLKASVRAALRSGATAVIRGGGATGAVARDLAIDTALGAALTGAMTEGFSEQAKKDLREQLTQQIKEQLDSLITNEEIDTMVNAAIEGSGVADVDFQWTAIDPTGVAEIIRSYNLPMCSAVQ